MDNFESDTSLSSNVSSLSSLYGNEFAELRQLVKIPIETDPTQLANDAEKVDRLLRANCRLQTEVETANRQIDRLIKNATEYQLEHQLHELRKECKKLHHQLAEAQELEAANSQLRVKFEKINADNRVKSATIEELKMKVSHQHVDFHTVLTDKNELIDKINKLNNRLSDCDKNVNWYKEQLNGVQNENIGLNKEIVQLKLSVARLTDENNGLNIDICKYKNEINEICLHSLKEKQQLFDELENIKVYTNNNKAVITQEAIVVVNKNDEEVVELKQDLLKILNKVQLKDEQIDKLSKENMNILANCLVLQKKLALKESEIDSLKEDKNSLNNKLNQLSAKEKLLDDQNVEFQRKLSDLNIQLQSTKSEKLKVEESIQLIRFQFQMFKSNYLKQKDELANKMKQILSIEKEKHEMFMECNWAKCELSTKLGIIESLEYKNRQLIVDAEKLKQNIDDYIEMKQLKEENAMLIHSINDLKSELRRAKTNANLVENYITDDQKAALIKTFHFDSINKPQLLMKYDKNIEDLQIKLQVQERSYRDKQRNMDKNNRTLLRKIKEHMRGRNAVEKQLKCLQKLYDDLADKYNGLQLSVEAQNRDSHNQELMLLSKEELIKNLENQLMATSRLHEESLQKIEFQAEEFKNSLSIQKSVEYSQESKKIESLQRELFFFQRLSNDLRIELNSYKKLQNPPLDDIKIRELLRQSKDESGKQQPVFLEINGCLKKLQNEIVNLQHEIMKKNRVA